MTLDINTLYRKIYKNKIKLLRYKMGFSYENAEDILQETFLKVVRLQHTYDPKKSKPETWFNYVLFSTVKTFLKQQHREEDKLLRLTSDMIYAPPADEIEVEDQDLKIYDLYFHVGYSLKEVASMLNMNYSTVTTRVSRLKERVKKLYENSNL